MAASVPAFPTGNDLGDRIRRNLEEGSAARRTGSEARTRADTFVTTSALLTYEVLEASVDDGSPSPERAAAVLANYGLKLPHGRTFHTNVARAVMGQGMDRDRLRRVAYAALELLEAKTDNPEVYIRDHGGVGGLAVRRERRLNPKSSSTRTGKSATTEPCYVLVRATKGATAEQRALVEQHATEMAPGPNGPLWVLPASAAFVDLVIGRAIVPIRRASDPSDLTVGDEPMVETVTESRHLPVTSSHEGDQQGLLF